jgi:hypothetical protein
MRIARYRLQMAEQGPLFAPEAQVMARALWNI